MKIINCLPVNYSNRQKEDDIWDDFLRVCYPNTVAEDA